MLGSSTSSNGVSSPSTTNVAVEITEALGRIARQATLPRFGEQVARRSGVELDRSAFVLLARLDEQPHRITELAEIVSLDVSTVSRQVDGLEQSGLANRVRHPTDRRGRLVVTTKLGSDTLDAHRQARRSIFLGLLDDVDPDQLAAAAAVLTHLADRIETSGPS